MKRQWIWVLGALFGFLSSFAADVPAFPGAEGFARYTTTGGRGGTVYHVTSLDDSKKEGTLRAAVTRGGVRTIVFDVSGTIELKSDLEITQGDITIAGQTAPGDGITLKNYRLFVRADNVIIRFIRCRLGIDGAVGGQLDSDAMEGRNRKNIIIDHCSMSWCTDECGSFYDNTDFTMQWCLLAESLRASVHPKGYHGYGGIWGGKGASFHHNMLANHDSRNPRLCGSRFSGKPELELVDMRNNVIYNWGNTNSGYAAEGGRYNIVNNYYKPGAATKESIVHRIFSPNADDGTNAQPKGTWGTFYVAGNYMDGTAPYSNVSKHKDQLDAVNADNWVGIHPDVRNAALPAEGIKSEIPYEVAPVTTHDAQTAFEKVLLYAGASYARDAVDLRVVREAREGTYTYTGSVLAGKGIIDNPNDVGGWPELKSSIAPLDSDGDGIPDDWERVNGLNPDDATDGAKAWHDGSGYTALEVYLHSLVDDIVRGGLADAETTVEEVFPTYVPTEVKEQASVTWGMTMSSSSPDLVADASVATVIGALEEPVFSINGLMFNSRKTMASEQLVGICMADTANWIAEPADNVYLEYSVKPAADKKFKVKSLNFRICSSGAATMRAKFYYSYGSEYGEAVQIPLKVDQNLKREDKSEGLETLQYVLESPVTLHADERFYFRIYPYFFNATGTLYSKYIFVKDVAFSGELISVPESVETIGADRVEASAYPNPFDGGFDLDYTLSAVSPVDISVYTLDGTLISRISEPAQAAGTYHKYLDASTWTAGIYFCRITTGNGSETLKLIKK